MPAVLINSLRRRRGSLGSCPACGHDVQANADALAYRGGFYHLVCALWQRECHGPAFPAGTA